MTKPQVDFFCIGAAKSATTWLAQCMNEHPDVHVSDPKEPNFFCQTVDLFPARPGPRYLNDWSWYESCFKGAARTAKRGDFSSQLLHNHGAPALLREHYPKARLLVLLRNPVARLYSHYWFRRQFPPRRGVPPSFEAALEHDHFVHRSRYMEQLEGWLEVWGKRRLHVMTDLQLEHDPGALLGDAFRFIRVDGTFRPQGLQQRIQPPSHPTRRARVAAVAGRSLRGVGLGGLAAAGSGSVARWTGRKRAPTMTQDQRELAWELVADDVRALEQKLRLDLTGWRPV